MSDVASPICLPVRSLRSLLSRFWRAEKGIALVEFAFTLPVMVILYLGSIVVTQGMMTDRKVTLLTRSLGDIVAQDTNVTAGERDEIFNAARVIMTPYDVDPSVIDLRVSSVRIKLDGSSCVEWSLAPSGSTFARAPGEVLDGLIPVAIRTPNTWLIMSEVQYRYNPIVGDDITGPILLNERLYMRPRSVSQVTSFNQPATPPCPET
jgi:hypothetical protein